jgi:hypothetical protein
LGVGFVLEEELDDGGAVVVEGGDGGVEGGLAVGVFGVGIGAVLKEEVDEGVALLADGAVEEGAELAGVLEGGGLFLE